MTWMPRHGELFDIDGPGWVYRGHLTREEVMADAAETAADDILARAMEQLFEHGYVRAIPLPAGHPSGFDVFFYDADRGRGAIPVTYVGDKLMRANP